MDAVACVKGGLILCRRMELILEAFWLCDKEWGLGVRDQSLEARTEPKAESRWVPKSLEEFGISGLEI
ncbi:hypothetical protein MPTK1_7g16340 [Marchantia polymorpha subsp. ruderalis]|uniref:Uncharacterized protein n=2 Tax=Marchantia polymorpha TaxID=3197 RepID=A0AAF6C0B6_MARPO|nr:hypothetical protein MARPO_0123s0016 [Marchantia polymorpha]BBN17700.1 hypothetical protein Mp_7g16340 [Marchantia polymorpha subsp. ruderalis]|eukprot:PTQ30523.1 hypothetical protein MARPO_0123s0016 [Marchantia polymorpha]